LHVSYGRFSPAETGTENQGLDCPNKGSQNPQICFFFMLDE
jgi:hypothetical protein